MFKVQMFLGMNNIITVVMTAPIERANKKISLDFYIIECIFIFIANF